MKIIIIGGGPGGYEAAIRGAQLGGEIVLIEKEHLGGTCLNEGCIPTKVLFKNASIMRDIKKSSNYGISTSIESVDMQKMQSVKNETISTLKIGVETLIKSNHIQYIQGQAQLIDSHQVEVKQGGLSEIISGDFIIVATGSEPVIPPIKGIENKRILDSAKLLNIDVIPKSITIVGAGVIGVEFAGIFNALGSQVTLIDTAKTVLPFLDTDLAKRSSSYLKKSGIKIMTETSVTAFKDQGDLVGVSYSRKGKEASVDSEYVLLAVGRKPRLLSGLDHLGVLYAHNGIKVDSNYKTNLSNIYAVGDVNGINMLAHVASHQGHSAIEHILLGKEAQADPAVTSCIFSFPEIAVVGESEKSLKSDCISYDVSKFSFAHNGKALTMQTSEGYVKVIAVNDVIVGAQIIGPHASDLIHEAALGIHNQLSVSDYYHTIHAHPTLSETFLEAVRGLHDVAIHEAPVKKAGIIKKKTS